MATQQNDVGSSIAKLYDSPTQLSAGAELTDREIVLTHDMGGQIFSERHRCVVRTIASPATAQSATIDVVAAGLPEQFKVLAAWIEADVTGRISNLALHLENEANTVSIPIYYWNLSGTFTTIRTAGGNTNLMVPSVEAGSLFPNRGIVGSRLTREATGGLSLALRGNTSAFGAGTVTVTARVLIAFFNRTNSTMPLGAVAPFPSW